MSQRIVNSTTFTFMRSSAQNKSLVSTLSISAGLNGTVVQCIEVRDSVTSASTTINVIDVHNCELDDIHCADIQ